MDLVNVYLKNSYIIIDIDQGEVMFAIEEGQLTAPYDAAWVIDEYNELKKSNQSKSNTPQ